MLMIAVTLFPGDSVVALVLLGVILGVLGGKMAGGIRMGFFLVATAVAFIATPHLAKVKQVANLDLGSLFTFKNVLWQFLMPQIIVFAVLVFLVVLVAEAFHKKIVLHYKYKGDDRYFESWEYMNAITGLALGVAAALVYLMALFTLIHPPGYLLVQVYPDSKTLRAEPRTDQFARRVFYDMNSLGLDKTTAWFSAASPRFYEAADTVGYIYNNGVRTNQVDAARFRNRVFAYPGLSGLIRNKSIQALRDDTNMQLRIMLGSQTNFSRLLGHPELKSLIKTAQLSGNTSTNEVLQTLRTLDFKDYHRFLREGQSGIYNSANANMPALVGMWQMDIANTHEQFRRKYPRGREPVYHALLNFLHKCSYMNQSVKGQPVREYDWTLNFYREGNADNGQVVVIGRHLPNLPLFDRITGGAITGPGGDAHLFKEPSLQPRRQQLATGQWKTMADKTKFVVDLKALPPYDRLVHAGTIQIIFTPAGSNKLQAEFPSCNSEVFIFERYQY